MLAGKVNLTRWYSSSLTRAPLRFASTLLNLPRTHIARTPSTAEACHQRSNSNYLFPTRPAAKNHNPHTTTNIAQLITWSHPLGRSSTRLRKFLKPRRKPKFRARPKQDEDKLAKALREAEEEYSALIAQNTTQDQTWNDAQAKDASAREESNTRKSPYFPSQPPPKLYDSQGNDIRARHAQSVNGIRDSSATARLSIYEASTEDLERELDYLARNEPNPSIIHEILKVLMSDRQIKPETRHYDALLLSNAWPEYGSVHNVESILSEMETEGIEIGATTLAAALKVLAIHPSVALSHQLLAMVNRRWIELAPESQHHLILAMIRTGQTELAAWTLDVLRDKTKAVRSYHREIIPDYLVVLLIAEMVKLGDWEGALRYMYKLRNRRAADRDIPVAFWGWLLDQASKAATEVAEASLPPPELSAHDSLKTQKSPSPTPYLESQIQLSNPAFWLSQYIWLLYVTPMSHHPSITLCRQILHLASLTGTSWLAHSAVTVITYLNGVDDTGTPRNATSEAERELVKVAEQRELQNEKDRFASQGRDWDAEMQDKERKEAERRRVAEEDEAWWKQVMDACEEQEPARDEITDKSAGDGYDMVGTGEGLDNDSANAKFTPFDPESVPPGNLWPLFPSIADIPSAHVDPWDALGPRSSSRRKWTEAQEHYKQVERTRKKK